MRLREHIILGAVASLALAPTLRSQTLVFLGASVLVDADHYLDFLYYSRFRAWAPRKMFTFHHYLWGQRHRSDLLALQIFHTLEWVVLLAAAAAWTGWTAMWVLLAGVLFHLGLDLPFLMYHGILSRRAHTVVGYFWKRRRLQRAGLDPDRPFLEALAALG